MSQVMQAAIAIADPGAGAAMEWDVRGDPARLWALLPELAADDVVIGVGAPLLAACGAQVPGLQAYARVAGGRYTMPATQHALWAYVPGASPGAVFEVAERLQARLAPAAHLVDAMSLFSYRQGRDLTGFRDGSANPVGDAAWAAALVAEGPWQHGSFVLVQRWLHFRERFAALAPTQRDFVIGRREDDDEELEDAPASAHIKRTEQEDFDPPALMLRRSMPWGDARRQGLQFIAFASDLDKIARMLRRMVGADDGIADALLDHTQAETGGYYFVPPVLDGRLVLPEAQFASAPAAAAPIDAAPTARNVIRLCSDGPFAIEGDFLVAGVPRTRAMLCRCGLSKRKPYCDRSHMAAKFSAAGEAQALAETHAATPPRPVRIQPIADGPLVVFGAVDLVTEDGRTVSRQPDPTLCRCGRSANKPFCDGAHAGAGFKAPD